MFGALPWRIEPQLALTTMSLVLTTQASHEGRLQSLSAAPHAQCYHAQHARCNARCLFVHQSGEWPGAASAATSEPLSAAAVPVPAAAAVALTAAAIALCGASSNPESNASAHTGTHADASAYASANVLVKSDASDDANVNGIIRSSSRHRGVSLLTA